MGMHSESNAEDPSRPSPVTGLLARIRAGDPRASGELLPLVYAQLQGLARSIAPARSAGHTLQPTALVHESWLKLAGHLGSLQDRTHFFAVAARAMRQVLANHARAARAQKRSSPRTRVSLDSALANGDATPGGAEQEVDLVLLDELLEKLADHQPRHAQVVELRLFGGLSVSEVALELDVTERTVYTDWAMAKAWLRTRIDEAEAGR